jgi:tetratricopeptide (TPR) repeat protein
MKLSARSLATLPLLLFSLSAFGQEAATSASEVQLGVESYKSSHYDQAAQHFQKAIDLDGSNLNAHLYLATVYVQEYTPGVDTPGNTRTAEKAIEHYQHVLGADAEKTQKVNSAKGIAYLYLNMKKFEDSKHYYQIASGLDPDDPENYYSLGVIDWTQCYVPRMEGRARLGLPPDENLNGKDPEQKKVCDELRTKNMSTVEEGIENLNKAIQVRPDYDDAMAYLNLMYRERADLECDNPAARTEDLTIADHWVDETLRVKKQKAEKSKALEKPTAPNPQ